MRIATVIIMVFALMLSSTSVFAGDTDPSGAQLRAIVDDYLKTAPPGDQNAEVIRAAEGADGMDPMGASAICTVEFLTGVGAAVWAARMAQDSCLPSSIKNAFDYCYGYTKWLDHWHWDPDGFQTISVFKDICTR